MAGNSGLEIFLPQREKSMRARLCDVTQLNINDISECCVGLDHKYIKGTIMSQWPPMHSNTVGKQVEFTIRDESLPDGKYIKVHLVGSIGNEFPLDAVGVSENAVYILNCSIIENSSNAPFSHKFHLSCNSNVDSPLIWLFRRKETSTETQEGKGPAAKKVMHSGYQSIADLKLTASVNLYGVVKTFKDVRKSNGEDHYSTAVLIDDSGEELTCNFFSSDPTRLPEITSVGDILRIHRLKIKSYEGCKQGLGVQKWGCSYVVFDGKCGQEIIPRTRTGSFQFTNYDKTRVSELREWAVQQDELISTRTCANLLSVSRGTKFDLICQVISRSIDVNNLRAYLVVWDGTKSLVNVRMPVQTDEAKETVRVDHGLEAKAGDLAVTVTLYDDHLGSVQSIKCGDFVRLCNVHAADYSDDGVDLCIHRGTTSGRGVFRYSPSDTDVLNLKKVLDGVDAGSSNNQEQRVASVTLHPNVPFSTITQMINSQVPHKHHLKVQVTQVFPSEVTKMVKLFCPQCKSKYDMARGDSSDATREVHDAGEQCPRCANKKSPPFETLPQLRYVFRMEVRLEDYTGAVNAYLVEEDVGDMFPDLPATNLFVDHACRESLHKRLCFLCGGKNPFDAPVPSMKSYSRPWFDCCVKSYYVGGKPKKSSDKRQVAYRIFDTSLKPLC